MDDPENISSSSSSSQLRSDWTVLQSFDDIEAAKTFIENELPKNTTRTSRKCKCTLCELEQPDTYVLHSMHLQLRYCKDKTCLTHDPTNSMCPVQYKYVKCDLINKAVLYQSHDHIYKPNNSLKLQRVISLDENSRSEAESPVKKRAFKYDSPLKPGKKTEPSSAKKPAPTEVIAKPKPARFSFLQGGKKSDPIVLKSESPTTPAKPDVEQVKEAPKKCAFDFLMNKKKQSAAASKKIESDSEIIVLEENSEHTQSANESPLPSNLQTNAKNSPVTYQFKHVVVDFINADFHLSHIKQYSNEDLTFLNQNINSTAWIKSNIEEFDAKQVSLSQPLNFEFKKLATSLSCNCKKNELYDSNVQSNVEMQPSESNELSSSIDEHLHRQNKRRRTELTAQTDSQHVRKMRGNESNHELWTEKYQFKSEQDIVTNSSQIERLKEWLQNWKNLLSNEGKDVKSKNKKNADSNSDSEYYQSDCSNADSVCSGYNRKFYTNAVLLSGPYGCGKTSSVYSIAKLLGFKVFEVNSSSSRCKSQIIQELEGALSSHHVSNNQNKLTNLINKETAEFKLDKFFKSSPFTKTKLVEEVSQIKKQLTSKQKSNLQNVELPVTKRTKNERTACVARLSTTSPTRST